MVILLLPSSFLGVSIQGKGCLSVGQGFKGTAVQLQNDVLTHDDQWEIPEFICMQIANIFQKTSKDIQFMLMDSGDKK